MIVVSMITTRFRRIGACRNWSLNGALSARHSRGEDEPTGLNFRCGSLDGRNPTERLAQPNLKKKPRPHGWGFSLRAEPCIIGYLARRSMRRKLVGQFYTDALSV